MAYSDTFTVAYVPQGHADRPAFLAKLVQSLEGYGLAVLTGVLQPDECCTARSALAANMAALCDGFDPADPTGTWTQERVLPSARDGLIRCGAGGLPTVTSIRSDPRVQDVFRAVNAWLPRAATGATLTEDDLAAVGPMVTSMDSIRFRPPVPPFYDDTTPDRLHVDVTTPDGQYACVQGQVVLAESTACLVASPKSHLLYHRFLNQEAVGGKGYHPTANWNPFRTTAAAKTAMSRALAQIGGRYQMPIRAPPGAMLVWLSSTVHSARVQTAPGRRDATLARIASSLGVPPPVPKPPPTAPLAGYLCVVNVCLRPLSSVDAAHVRRLQWCALFNRQTDHWGHLVLPCVPPTQRAVRFTEKIAELTKRPWRAYALVPPAPTPQYLELLGYSPDDILQQNYVTPADFAGKTKGELVDVTGAAGSRPACTLPTTPLPRANRQRPRKPRTEVPPAGPRRTGTHAQPVTFASTKDFSALPVSAQTPASRHGQKPGGRRNKHG
jgi:hypothetical protein